MINVGDRLPDAEFFVMTADGLGKRTGSELFSGRKVALFAVPGAFTPTCHMNHLPGFLNNADALKAKGVAEIACVSVNDPFVMKAWGEATDASGTIAMLSDGNGDFTKAIGLEMDGSGAGLGHRSKRYAMLVDDGVVKVLHVEDVPSTAEASSAEALLAAI